uniref:ribosomal protein L22 n=1 Tax=Corydalis fargesii TaxID=2973992 RepID=UPI0021824581|nr:ribosomal protein L22 [Corydalis fargesii]UVH69094.1 ribosomal protein L22 [Corydalis fargesii]
MRKNNKVGEYAYSQHTRLSVNKARRVIDQIRGRSYDEALQILGLMPYRACEPILKLVSSAADNASHNMKIKKKKLVISKAEVNRGTIRKKLKPRARGHSYPIKRTTCRITIVLIDIFDIRVWKKRVKSNAAGQNLLTILSVVFLILETIEILKNSDFDDIYYQNIEKNCINMEKDSIN